MVAASGVVHQPGFYRGAAVRKSPPPKCPLGHGARFVRALTSWLDGTVPVISVGGIVSPEDARERLEAGAALIQLYRGFADQGPGLIRRINEFLRGRLIASATAAPITGRRTKLVDRPTTP